MELECVGVTAIRNAIAPPLLAELQAAHDEVCARIRRNVPPEEWSWENPDYPGVVDFFRAFEHHAVFEELLDGPFEVQHVLGGVVVKWPLGSSSTDGTNSHSVYLYFSLLTV